MKTPLPSQNYFGHTHNFVRYSCQKSVYQAPCFNVFLSENEIIQKNTHQLINNKNGSLIKETPHQFINDKNLVA